MDPKQEEQPPVEVSPRKRRRTAAVADVRVNQEAGTPVDRLAREMGAESIPELGRARDRDRNGGQENDEPENGEPDRDFAQRSERALAGEPAPAEEDEVAVKPSEARRTLKERREHSKGDGNFPAVEPGLEMLDERPEDRQPRDLPKARDDRSAPKGNVTLGQDDRNPDLAARDDFQAERKPSGAKMNMRKQATPARAKATRKATRPAGRAKATATRTPRRAKITRKAPKPTARKTARSATRKASRPARRTATRSKRRATRR